MSRIIRGSGTAAPPGEASGVGADERDRARVVPREVFDASGEATKILAAAHERAARLVADAETEARRLHAEARRNGREDGVAQAAALIAEASTLRDRALADAERHVVELALAATKRIVGEEVALAPQRIVDIVGEVLARARRATRVVVRVHPDDARTLEAMLDRVRASAASASSFAIEADAEVTRGGCVVVTDVGELDARIEVKLDALARALGCEP